MGKRAIILSALLALIATLLLAQPAGAQEEDPCATPPPGAITGTDGNDVLRGTPGNDVIVAGGGDDVVLSLGGDDLVCGGLGDDKIITGDGDDLVAADDLGFFGDPNAPGGNDVVVTGAGDDGVLAGPGNDTVNGGAGADFLALAQGNDLVNGGAGDDTLIGDLPGQTETGLPPTPDPNPNFDTCIGAAGTDAAYLCERTIAVESVS
jgi:Ca2+-binding RTX toxin-like protein